MVMSVMSRRVQEIFERVVGLGADERAAVVADLCAGEPEVRAEVDRLLRAHTDAVGFLDAPTARFSEDGAPTLAEIEEGPGAAIGRYRLIEAIGEGGFGRVFRAEQREPVRREVALKIIKLGMDTRQVIARFEAERQALAMMDHPGIARVFDAGATANGRPYFVMELVRGVPITQFCDANRLRARERLELFIRVCGAVQHAHQKGVIHRDLKPSNILVTLHDGEPTPKVIDFGIAKATSARLTERTLYTEFRQFVGTPEYVSPEQAEMGGLDVDTRADVYSLGVLLYELLVGKTPFDPDQLRSGGFPALQRLIRESDPPRPSTRYSTLGAERSPIARNRGEDPDRFGRMLRGDLEWVVMRALEKSRSRRYQTAAALAEDVGRYLRDEPVEAGPPGAAYRLRKLAKRNRGALVAGGVGVAVVIAALVGTSVGLVRARAAQADERAARLEAEEANRLSRQIVRSSETWLTGMADEVARIVAGGDARTFGREMDQTSYVFEGGPMSETMEVAGLAHTTAGAMASLVQALGEARARSEAASARLEALRGYVGATFDEDDPRRATLERILEMTDPSGERSPANEPR
jgi:hypothetical protein